MRSPIETLEARRYLHDENGVPLTSQPEPANLIARINFQPAGLRPPKHYTADIGLPFGNRSAAGLRYGWDRNVVDAGYLRGNVNVPDARYDSFIASQQGGDAIWEVAVPNGQYTVRVVTGEPTSPNSTARVAVEGVLTVNGVSNTTTPWYEGTATVAVTDGRITLTNAAGAANNKLDFIEIMAGPAALPHAAVTATDDRAIEGGAGGSFRISRSGSTAEELVVNYVMTGKAKNGVDYQTLGGVAEIAPGQTFVDVPLNAIVDSTDEGTESVGMYLIYSQGTTTDTNLFATARISDPAATTPPDPVPTPSTTLAWTRGADAPSASAEALTAVVSGRLYRFGGFYDSTFNQSTRADYYNPATNKWVRVADMPKAITHAGVVAVGTDIYVIGGYLQTPGNSTGGAKTFGIRDVLIYHTLTNTWGTGTSLPVARASGSAALIGRNLYYAGGENGGRSADAADLYVLNLDNTAAGWVKKTSMPASKNHFGMAAIDGKLYAVGGQTSFDATSNYLNTNFRYDPSTNVWTTLAPMTTRTSHITNSTLAYNGKLITLGGETTGRVQISNVNQYDPATNSWKSLTSLPGKRLSPAAGLIDGKFYVAGGSSGPQERTLFIGTFS